jgi:hypothetical protein
MKAKDLSIQIGRAQTNRPPKTRNIFQGWHFALLDEKKLLDWPRTAGPSRRGGLGMTPVKLE